MGHIFEINVVTKPFVNNYETNDLSNFFLHHRL